MNPFINKSLCLLLGASLAACGGGGGGLGDRLAGGGISGTGSGTITAFGSIILNDSGEFETETAEILIDEVEATESDLARGMVAQVEVSEVDEDFTTGRAERVAVIHEIKGPVTSVNPLAVLGQSLVITGETRLEAAGDGALDPASLSLGDEVEVSGQRNAAGVVLVSRLEQKAPDELSRWQLLGTLSEQDATGFTIGGQRVEFSGPSLDCGAGERVKVTSTDFFLDDGWTADAVSCRANRLQAPEDSAAATIEGEFEGFVTSPLVDGVLFELGDQPVRLTTGTRFEGGALEDLQPGVKLDAKGAFNTQTGELEATRIRFRNARFRLEGPLTAIEDSTLSLLGLSVAISPLTEVDEDVAVDTQVRVRGFVENARDAIPGNEALFADRVDDRDETPDFSDLRLRGPVTAINTDRTFEVLGIPIDLATATAATDFAVGDRSVLRAEFEAALSPGDEVDIEDAAFAAGSLSLENAELDIEIEDD